MKTTRILFLAGVLSFLLMGCPYESTVPVDDPSNCKPNKGLVGRWEQKGKDDFEWDVTLEGNIYKFEQKYLDGSDPYEKEVYFGTISDVAGTSFLSLWSSKQEEGQPRKYMIFKIENKGDERVVLYEMTDNIKQKFESSAELKAFIKKNKDVEWFYNINDGYNREIRKFYKNE
ncbi:MAG: hypothetical protein Fur0041_12320 [Bacteroidia bacterium]